MCRLGSSHTAVGTDDDHGLGFPKTPRDVAERFKIAPARIPERVCSLLAVVLYRITLPRFLMGLGEGQPLDPSSHHGGSTTAPPPIPDYQDDRTTSRKAILPEVNRMEGDGHFFPPFSGCVSRVSVGRSATGWSSRILLTMAYPIPAYRPSSPRRRSW